MTLGSQLGESRTRPVRIGLIEEPGWGPLHDPTCLAILRASGVEVVRPWWRAQWVVGLRRKRLDLARTLMPWKSYLVYTDDPRFDRNPSDTYPRRGHAPRIHVLNAYADELFWDNFAFVETHQIGTASAIDRVDVDHFLTREKILAAAVGFGLEAQADQPPPYGANLHKLRVDIIRCAYRRGFGALQGAGWPQEFDSSDTGWTAESAGLVDRPWSVIKLEWLKQFWFNLCYENTLAPYYVTEKIWHAVMAGCVPVYFGNGSTIWESFPAGSFVDGSQFSQPRGLLDYLQNMTPEEAVARLNLCLESFVEMKAAPSNLYNERRAERLARWLHARA